MSLKDYWPEKGEIDRCIKREAEASNDAVLLAVHQTYPLAYMMVGPDGKVITGSKQYASERDILNHLLGSASEGSLVVPITGASGVGKSHLIRIIEARIKHLEDASRYVVIRIPKSASLRKVVSLILEVEPLQSASYDTVRNDFNGAHADITMDYAVIRFQAELKIALRNYCKELETEILAGQFDTRQQQRLQVARNLPDLLGDASLVDYFSTTVIPRIISRSVQGVGLDKAIDVSANTFKVTDFDFPESVDVTQASIPVRNFCIQILNHRDGYGKEIGVEVLNAVLDQATQQLFKLNDSLGGKTLGEIILDIRRILFEEDPKKELVILVEDFKALVGIQESLAMILIQNGVTDGVQTMATIRSAIAVPDGYLAGRDTLATRAGREWIVESKCSSEEEVRERTRCLVASYLNAVRHGEQNLEQFINEQSSLGGFDIDSWEVPIFSKVDDDTQSTLDAFGYVGKIPLFPFTEKSIDFLARRTLTVGNALNFTPRHIIVNVIRDVLEKCRDSFLAGQFPPATIIDKGHCSADVASWINQQGFDTSTKKRYERFVSVWGNDPKAIDDVLSIPEGIFKEFSLPAPKGCNSVPPERIVIINQPPINIDEVDPRILKAREYSDTIENWVRTGEILPQKEANLIRRSIAELMNEHIDFNAQLCIGLEIMPGHFSLPRAGGEGGLHASVVKVAETLKDDDGRLRHELIALLRHVVVYNKSFDYDGSEDDRCWVKNLIDRLRPAALSSVNALRQQGLRRMLLALAENSQLLGLVRRESSPSDLLSFLFGSVEQISSLPEYAPEAFQKWREYQQVAYGIREGIIDVVHKNAACFQGTGNTPYGVDVLGLFALYSDVDVNPQFTKNFKVPDDLMQRLTGDFRLQSSKSRYNGLFKEAEKISAEVNLQFGPAYNKQEIVSIVKDLAVKLKEDMGAWPQGEIGMTLSNFVQICEDFRSSAITASLRSVSNAQSIDISSPEGELKRFGLVAQIRLTPLVLAVRFINASQKVIRSANNHANTLEIQYAGVKVDEKATCIIKTFENINRSFERIRSGGQNVN